jgi:hypothetical protein
MNMNTQTVLLPASILLLASCQNQQSEPAQFKKPNVLFILADDLGYHDLSCMGSKFYETPHIDRIANEGMIFTEGYANSQVCSPSRASIMSGKFPARHGITDWIGARTGEDWRNAGRFTKLLPPEYVTHLPHEYITLPEAMKEAGYKTFFAGKWHIGGKGSWPEDHGFDINKGGWDVGSPGADFMLPGKTPIWKAVRMEKALPSGWQEKQPPSSKSIKTPLFLHFFLFMQFMHHFKPHRKNGPNTGKKLKIWALLKQDSNGQIPAYQAGAG